MDHLVKWYSRVAGSTQKKGLLLTPNTTLYCEKSFSVHRCPPREIYILIYWSFLLRLICKNAFLISVKTPICHIICHYTLLPVFYSFGVLPMSFVVADYVYYKRNKLSLHCLQVQLQLGRFRDCLKVFVSPCLQKLRQTKTFSCRVDPLFILYFLSKKIHQFL